jgi:DNA repair photolyase
VIDVELLMNKSPEIEVDTVLNRFQGRSVKVEDFLQNTQNQKDIGKLCEKLRKLEVIGKIYIERFPRLEGSVLRRDIRKSDIVYFDAFPSISRKSLLYKTKVEYGDYTINHLSGCAHGCLYPCYAMNMSKRWGRISDYEDWMHPRIVENALELLDKELPQMNGDISFIHLSFMTDPFMYDAVNERTIPWIEQLTLDIIRKINANDKKVTLLTKGLIPETLKNDEYSKDNEYGITLVSLQDKFKSQFEPYSAPPRDRLNALEKLHDYGLKTWISLEPYPTPNIVQQNLADILAEISFVDKIVFGKWNYSALVNGHNKSDEFYRENSDEVIRFCTDNNIQLHIKKGTPRSSERTNGIFA